jgi:itaconyl-CoA hydratase
MSRSPFELPDGFAFAVRSRGRTITEGDFSAMTNLTWSTMAVHVDKVATLASRGHERMLAGGGVLAFALGLATPNVEPSLHDRGVSLIALLGYDEVRFHSPLFPGDTIYVESELAGVLRTSRPERGLISFKDVVVDHEGRMILSYTRTALCDVSRSDLQQDVQP